MCVCVYTHTHTFKQSGSLVSGVGTSLVLTQTDIVRHSYYPRGSHSVAISHLVSYLGAPVSQFSMPLLFLGFLSLYETREALLLQAGVVLHGLVGTVILHSPNLRPPTISRYRSRPRAFTFVNDESVYSSSSNGNSRDRYVFSYVCLFRGSFHEQYILKPF